MEAYERAVIELISWVHLGIEILGALVVIFGVLAALAHVAGNREKSERPRFHGVRLLLSQYLTMALEFQLAADILATTIAPSWAEIGKRSEEHTSELQSRPHLVCRLLLEKKKKKNKQKYRLNETKL